jgi:hypothetical protein
MDSPEDLPRSIPLPLPVGEHGIPVQFQLCPVGGIHVPDDQRERVNRLLFANITIVGTYSTTGIVSCPPAAHQSLSVTTHSRRNVCRT